MSTASESEARRIRVNAASLMTGSILTMLTSLVVVPIAARQYGAEGMGRINFAFALTYLFTAVSTLSVDTVLVRRLLAEVSAYREGVLLGSAFVARCLSGAAVVVASCCLSLLLDRDDKVALTLVFLMSGAMAVRAFEVVDSWVQVHLKALVFTVVRVSCSVAIAVIKILIVYFDGGLILYASSYALDALLVGVASFFTYRALRSRRVRWVIRPRVAVSLVRESAPLIGAGMLISASARIDQVLVGVILPDPRSVGLYSAAIALGEMWYFLPVAIVVSLKTAALDGPAESPQAQSAFRAMFRLVAWFSVLLCAGVAVFSEFIVRVLYGSDFVASAQLLSIVVWAGIPIMLNTAVSVWLIARRLQRYAMVQAFVSLVFILGTNLWVLPRVGLVGAAIGRVIAQVSGLLVLWFFVSTRGVVEAVLTAFSPRSFVEVVSSSYRTMEEWSRRGRSNGPTVK